MLLHGAIFPPSFHPVITGISNSKPKMHGKETQQEDVTKMSADLQKKNVMIQQKDHAAQLEQKDVLLR